MMSNISQITIYLKGGVTERVNEVALYSPLSVKAEFDQRSETLEKRKWTFERHLNMPKRLVLKIQSLFFPRKKSAESKFKTVLAILLSQEELREYFLGTPSKKKHFFDALLKAAQKVGYQEFKLPEISLEPSEIASELTTLNKKNLIHDLNELNLQIATLKEFERNEILFHILNDIERPPVTSVLEVASDNALVPIEMTTHYGKYEVQKIDGKTGKIQFTVVDNQATSSVNFAGVKGAMNQRVVKDPEGKMIGSYSGALLSTHHVLEQLLFLLKEGENSTYYLQNDPPPLKIAEDKLLLFTSLFSWNELEKIQKEHAAIDALHNKVLKIVKTNGEESIFRLKLYHQNLSFGAWNKFPTPGEVKAQIVDINTACLIQLLPRAFRLLKEKKFPTLLQMAEKIDQARSEKDFLKKQRIILDEIDAFQGIKKEVITYFENDNSELALILKALLSKPKVGGIDELIYTTLLTKHLKIIHPKNCETSTDKTAAANAADKAQYAFYKIHHHHFLPLTATDEEKKLFQVIYSMYLVWEEPELNTGLSTGFIGEKYFRNFIQRNPETTRYLMTWLKAHPELYLGLSHYR